MSIINLPVSKSIGARFLVASYFAGTLPECRRFSDCDDLKVIQEALLDLYRSSKEPSPTPLSLDIHASGTAFRFMAATVASTPGADVVLTGTKRLCSRPMTPLLEVLRQAGASVEALGENGSGPYHI
ncbi:MAG: 3-phosphoshikimate 1-carboxyvinyltransferase, partial [Muribaculaceae bacterium]|nr:3-phosphoshikimate 1-carboxyvinyltransferase [Muribaculaceae bacterium]